MKAQLFVLTLLLVSCSESQKRVSFSENITAKSTALREAFISVPMDIKKRGGILYASDFKGGRWFAQTYMWKRGLCLPYGIQIYK